MSILDGAFLFECLVIYMLSQNFQNLTHTAFHSKCDKFFPFVGNIQGGDEFLKSIHVVTFLHARLKGRMAKCFFFQPNSLKCFWTFCNKISLLWFMEQKL